MILGKPGSELTNGYSIGSAKYPAKRRNCSGARSWSRKQITRWSSNAWRSRATVSASSGRRRSGPKISAPSAPDSGRMSMPPLSPDAPPRGKGAKIYHRGIAGTENVLLRHCERSEAIRRTSGLLRRCAPRNDDLRCVLCVSAVTLRTRCPALRFEIRPGDLARQAGELLLQQIEVVVQAARDQRRDRARQAGVELVVAFEPLCAAPDPGGPAPPLAHPAHGTP